MMGASVLLLFIAVIGVFLGLIKPSLVIFGNIQKTRGKVILIYGIIFIVGIIFGVIGAPNNFELAQTALARQDYETAVEAFERLSSSDPNYAEAQRLLVEAREKLKVTRAKKEQIEQENADRITQDEDNKRLTQLADEQDKEAKRKAEERDKETKRKAKEQETAMADYPDCASKEAEIEIANAMENAPLGRVFGLSVVKVSNAEQVAVSSTFRRCQGSVQLSNAQTYPIVYRFYRDGEDVLVAAEVQGLDE